MPDEYDREAWTAVCAGLRRIRDDANWFALRPYFDELVQATRAGALTLAGWQDLTEEIARLKEAERNETIRHGEAGNEPSAHWSYAAETAHNCPRSRCDRIVRAAPTAPPDCPLFGVPMPEIPISGQAE